MVDKNAHYLMCKGGVYYLTRHVPNDLSEQYNTPRIVICLKTRNKNSALKASKSMAGKLDDFWLHLRVANMNVPAADKLTAKQPLEAQCLETWLPFSSFNKLPWHFSVINIHSWRGIIVREPPTA